MWVSGSGGSGVVLVRLPDGSWSGPSSFTVTSGGFGMVYGLDVYDCVCILNTDEAVEAYSKPELSLKTMSTPLREPGQGTVFRRALKEM